MSFDRKEKNNIELECAEYISAIRELNLGKELYFYIKTFGCQQNEADSEIIAGMAASMGYKPTASPEEADLILLNTCAVREHAEMKALSLLGRFKALKIKKPELIIGVCGCMAARGEIAELLKKSFHYVSFCTTPSQLYNIPKLIYGYIAGGKRRFLSDTEIYTLCEGLPRIRCSSHKAWVSIMYGCNNFCSYCIVPYTRGRERSRASADIINECRELVLSGVREITLLGQNVNSYKSDIGFAELIARIAAIEGDFIIRFMTSHPKDVSDELIDTIAKYSDKIAPYFHLPVQSGSEKILAAMNRAYTRDSFLDVVNKLRGAVPGICLSTDIIVGFPRESEEDFEDTLSLLGEVEFDMVYAFMYSKRSGTPAADMHEQIPHSLKEERLNRLLSIQDPISLGKNNEYIGRVIRVLVDSISEADGNRVITARTATNKLVHFSSESARIGEFVNVEIESAKAYSLIAKETKNK